MVSFKGAHHTLTPGDIPQVEAELGLRLPDDFRRHYLRYNGGKPDPGYFEKDGEWYIVRYFFPLKERSAGNSFEEMYRILVNMTPEFPRGFVPFATADGGECLIFSTRRQDYGAIFLNRQDYADDPERCVDYLANSLDSLLAGLVDAPD